MSYVPGMPNGLKNTPDHVKPRMPTHVQWVSLLTWWCKAVTCMVGEQCVGGRPCRNCFFMIAKSVGLVNWNTLPLPLYYFPLCFHMSWLSSTHPASAILNWIAEIHPNNLFSPDCLGKSLINMLMHGHKKCSFIFWNVLCLVYKNRTVQISRVLFSKLVPLINWLDYVFVGCLCYLHHRVSNLSTVFWEIVRICFTRKHRGEKKYSFITAIVFDYIMHIQRTKTKCHL